MQMKGISALLPKCIESRGKKKESNLPLIKDKIALLMLFLSHYGDSNPGPTHYECVALPTEP